MFFIRFNPSMEEIDPKKRPHFFHISLKVILENEKGEILGLKCKDEKGPLDGYYDFPGGRIDSNELDVAYEDIIKREMIEEIGKDAIYEGKFLCPVSTGKFKYFSHKLQKDNCIFMLFFKAKYLGGNILVSDEHKGFEWLDLKTDPPEKYFTLGFLDGIKEYLKNKDGDLE